MRVRDYFVPGRRGLVRLHEKGDKGMRLFVTTVWSVALALWSLPAANISLRSCFGHIACCYNWTRESASRDSSQIGIICLLSSITIFSRPQSKASRFKRSALTLRLWNSGNL